MAARSAGLLAVVTVVVLALLAGLVLPISVNAIDESDTELEQNESETYTVTIDLETTANTIDDTSDDVTVTLEDADTGDSDSATIDEGNTSTLTVEGEEIDVTVEAVQDGTTATLSYTYPTTYGWPDTIGTLFGLLPELLIATVLTAAVGWLVGVV